MTQFYRYRSTFGVTLWIEDLGNDSVRLGSLSLTQLAEHLQVGTSSITLDDPDADLGHSGDAIRGLQRFDMVETDEDADNERVWFGYIGQREYRRGDTDRPSLRTSSARQITLSLVDLNCIPGFAMFPNDYAAANRSAETIDARMAWLLATPHFSGNVYDAGLIESNTTVMSATNYQGQTAANVIGDMEIAAGFGWNAFMYLDVNGSTTHHALAFFNANTSTLYSSDLRISNDLADIDTATAASFLTGTTFAPNYDATLTRDPGEVASRIYIPWDNGTVYRTRAATEDIFGRRDLAAPNTNIRSAAKAQAVADDFLFQHSTETDNITVRIEVPTSKVNHIKAGQRLEVKFTHFPGYESFTWCRVIRRTVIQEQATDRYIIDMDLSPQEAPCDEGTLGIRQHADSTDSSVGYADFAAPVLAGSLILVSVSWRPASGPATLGTAMDPAGPSYTTLVQTEAQGDQYTGLSYFARDATGGEQHIERDPAVNALYRICAYEITGASVADLEVHSASRQTSSVVPATISAHVAATGKAFMTFNGTVVEPGFSLPDVNNWSGIAGAGWTEHFDGPVETGFAGTWISPYIWQGTADGDGSDLTPSVTVTKPALKTVSEWSMISVLVPGETC